MFSSVFLNVSKFPFLSQFWRNNFLHYFLHTKTNYLNYLYILRFNLMSPKISSDLLSSRRQTWTCEPVDSPLTSASQILGWQNNAVTLDICLVICTLIYTDFSSVCYFYDPLNCEVLLLLDIILLCSIIYFSLPASHFI